MLKIIPIIALTFFLSACSNPKTIDGITYATYGLLNSDDNKNPNITYKLSIGNLIWGCILIETIIAPIYFFGFDIFEPVGKNNGIKGQING